MMESAYWWSTAMVKNLIFMLFVLSVAVMCSEVVALAAPVNNP
jgi:hypothetical protein